MSTPAAPAASPTDRSTRPRRAADAGFTIIEVLVAALIVAVVSTAAATAFISTLDSSGNLRIRAEAQALAQQNQAELRGLTVDELSNLNQTLGPKSIQGTQFTVQETATYVSDATGTPSCTNPSADYLKTTSTVTWPNMDGAAPVSVSSVLTPTIGSVDPTHGTLAVLVDNSQSVGLSGMNVVVSNSTYQASGQTASDGCVLFSDLPANSYQVSVAPTSGTYVDEKSGATVTATQPDYAPQQVQVTAGSTAPGNTQFFIDQGGTANVSFTDSYPATVSPSPAPAVAAPAVIFASNQLASPGYRLCSGADVATGCPQATSPDTSFAYSAWVTSLAAAPLFPNTYTTYAGVCTSDEPHVYGGTDSSVTITPGGQTAVALSLPAMVIRLMSSNNTELPLPNGASLVVSDTGCGMNYATNAPASTAHQSALAVNSSYGTGVNDTGILTNPGMPYGRYTVCYQTAAGLSYTSPAFTNGATQGQGEIINIPVASATSTSACP